MRVDRNADGLYTFTLTLNFRSHTRKLIGLVDTGSNICACTYKIPTTLRARPTSFAMVNSPTVAEAKPAHGYSLNIGFDGKSVMTHVYRLPLEMGNIDFILGLPVLSKCNTVLREDYMDITWL